MNINENRLKPNEDPNSKQRILSIACIAIVITLIAGVFISNLINGGMNEHSSSIGDNQPTNKTVIEEEEKENLNSDPTPIPGMLAEEDREEDSEKENTASSNATKQTTSVSSTTLNLDNIIYPLESRVVTMDYSYNTTPVYSNTLNAYRSDHTGVDFKGENGEDVKVVLDGVVEKIYHDEKLGYTILVDHGNNFKSLYGNLEEEALIKEGDSVKAGSVVGKIGSSSLFESLDPIHLHFSIIKNDEFVDPMDYLK